MKRLEQLTNQVAVSMETVLLDPSPLRDTTESGHDVSYPDEGALSDSSVGQATCVSTQESSSFATLSNVGPWDDIRVAYKTGGRFMRGIRQIATSAMLCTTHLFIPATSQSWTRDEEEIEDQFLHHWLHQIRIADAEVPCPPVRFSETYRIFPPSWDDIDPIEIADPSFLFAQEH